TRISALTSPLSLPDALPISVDELFAQPLRGVHGRVSPGEQVLGCHLTMLVGLSESDAHREGKVLPRRQGYERLAPARGPRIGRRSEEHTSELQSRSDLVCRL